MRNHIPLFVFAFLLLSVAACFPEGSESAKHTSEHTGKKYSNSSTSDSFTPGMGMSYTGRLGLEIAPGIVMTPGSRGPNMGLGFGF